MVGVKALHDAIPPGKLCHAGTRASFQQQQQQQQQQQTSFPLASLPADLLGQVLKSLPESESALPRLEFARGEAAWKPCSIRAVCRSLRDAFDSSNERLVLTSWGWQATSASERAERRANQSLIPRLITRTPGLNSLSLRFWGASVRELEMLPVPWGQLGQMELPDLIGHAPPGKGRGRGLRNLELAPPLTQCSTLRELEVNPRRWALFPPGRPAGTGAPLPLLPFSSTLSSLSLWQPSNSELAQLSGLFPALRHLGIHTLFVLQTGEVETPNLASIASCTRLMSLHLNLSQIHAEGSFLSTLSTMSQLTCLHLCGCWWLEDLQPLAGLSWLRQLEFSECSLGIQDISALSSLGALERLSLASDSCAADNASHLSHLTALRCLNLKGCTYLRHPASDFEYEEGEEDNPGRISYFELSPLSPCTLLESLDLSECWVHNLHPLAPCARLRQLRLRGCLGLWRLVPLSSLVLLELAGCEQLSDISALSASVRLQYLDMGGCNELRSLAPLSACVRLKQLALWGCEKV